MPLFLDSDPEESSRPSKRERSTKLASATFRPSEPGRSAYFSGPTAVSTATTLTAAQLNAEELFSPRRRAGPIPVDDESITEIIPDKPLAPKINKPALVRSESSMDYFENDPLDDTVFESLDRIEEQNSQAMDATQGALSTTGSQTNAALVNHTAYRSNSSDVIEIEDDDEDEDNNKENYTYRSGSQSQYQSLSQLRRARRQAIQAIDVFDDEVIEVSDWYV